MYYKIKLKNSDDSVTVDESVYQYLVSDPYLVKVKFVDSLRKHSSGCCVFQKIKKMPDATGIITETIYLHKLIAEQFKAEDRSLEKRLVGCKNGNKLDCRLENIAWRSRAVASRQRKASGKLGYTGVYKENHRYRAVISINKKSVHLGMFDSPEQAALAYNKKSVELYGADGKINIIKQ